MSLIPAVQYWFFVVFMQFVPLSEVEIGNTFEYTIAGMAYSMLIEVEDVSYAAIDDMKWTYSISYIGKNAPETTHKAVLAYNSKYQMHITSFKEDERELLNKGEIVKLPKNRKALIISTDNAYLLQPKQSYETEIDTQSGTVSCNKQTFVANDGFKTEVFYDDLFGLIRVILSDSSFDQEYEITRKK